MNIFDLLTAKKIGTYYDASVKLAENNGAIPYLGAALFPALRTDSTELSWLKGYGGLPIAITPSNYDAKATIREHRGLSEVATEMSFYREGSRVGEKLRQRLNNAAAANNAAMYGPLLKRIYDDTVELINGTDVAFEMMRMQIMTTGIIQVSSKTTGVKYNYDFKMPTWAKPALTDAAKKWSATDTATPVQDIMAWKKLVQTKSGIVPTRAVTSSKILGYLVANKSIRLDMDPIGGTNRIITEQDVLAYISRKVGLQVVVYDKMYATSLDSSTTATRFLDETLFVLLPPSTLGNSYYGVTPEESDLMTGASRADVQIVNTGIAVTTYKEEHPVNVVTIVSGVMLPSFEAMGKTLTAKVIDAE